MDSASVAQSQVNITSYSRSPFSYSFPISYSVRHPLSNYYHLYLLVFIPLCFCFHNDWGLVAFTAYLSNSWVVFGNIAVDIHSGSSHLVLLRVLWSPPKIILHCWSAICSTNIAELIAPNLVPDQNQIKICFFIYTHRYFYNIDLIALLRLVVSDGEKPARNYIVINFSQKD